MERSWRSNAMGKRYRSDALAAVHETALGLTEAGVMDKRTMKAFDEMCLTPVKELTAKQIRQIRMREKASQAVFARYLNAVSYTHLRAHETDSYLVCRLLL